MNHLFIAATLQGSPPAGGDSERLITRQEAQNDEFLTVKDVQRILNVSRGTVYNMIHGIKRPDGSYRLEPSLPHYKVGSWGIRIKRSDLEDYLRRGAGDESR